jgi:hypothetical protein
MHGRILGGNPLRSMFGLDQALCVRGVGKRRAAHGCAGQGWTKLRKFQAAVFLDISESFRTCMRGWRTVVVSCIALKMSAFYRSVAGAVRVDMRLFGDMSSLRFIAARCASLQMES